MTALRRALRALLARSVPAAPLRSIVDVEGTCPACRHPVLILDKAGRVACTLMDCPDPDAARNLLNNPPCV
ncbi:MAG: hypothetical protein HOY79_33755 [Streptomyces sp.]|nr:hypothetical protein [Streptomyces sp.]NUS23383.1 hypothetical protein [Streptomyces sp.]